MKDKAEWTLTAETAGRVNALTTLACVNHRHTLVYVYTHTAQIHSSHHDWTGRVVSYYRLL